MKKVIILCSALVFDFLTCSDASATVDINSVSYQNAREAIEDELTELLKESNEKEVKLYMNEFERRLNSSPKKVWLNSSEMIIENGRVKFKDSNSKGYKSDPKLFRDYLSDVRGRINQLKAQRQAAQTQTKNPGQNARGIGGNQRNKPRTFGNWNTNSGTIGGNQRNKPRTFGNWNTNSGTIGGNQRNKPRTFGNWNTNSGTSSTGSTTQ